MVGGSLNVIADPEGGFAEDIVHVGVREEGCPRCIIG